MVRIASLSIVVLVSACAFGCHAPTDSPAGAGSSASAASESAGRPTESSAARVVDVPTRSGVTDRVLVLAPEGEPKAAVVLFAGGNGGLRLDPTGAFGALSANFLIRSRRLFVDHGLLTVAIDAPSDRQSQPYMAGGFRESAKSAADVKAVIAWLRTQTHAPIWLVGTSHGTQSAAFAAASLAGAGGPDGLVLTSTVTRDDKEKSVPAMELDRVRTPVLLIHHVHDACSKCPFSGASDLLAEFTSAPRKELIPIDGGEARGDACEAWAHHGFNGNETEVVARIARWITAR